MLGAAVQTLDVPVLGPEGPVAPLAQQERPLTPALPANRRLRPDLIPLDDRAASRSAPDEPECHDGSILRGCTA